MLVVFLFVFSKTFEGGGGLGHRKSMSLETHLLAITEQAMQVTHIGFLRQQVKTRWIRLDGYPV